MATLIKSSGERLEINPKSEGKFFQKELVDLLGDCIELYPYPYSKNVMIIDEEATLNKKPHNPLATKIAHANHLIEKEAWIDGDVLICKKEEL